MNFRWIWSDILQWIRFCCLVSDWIGWVDSWGLILLNSIWSYPDLPTAEIFMWLWCCKISIFIKMRIWWSKSIIDLFSPVIQWSIWGYLDTNHCNSPWLSAYWWEICGKFSYFSRTRKSDQRNQILSSVC